MSTYLSLYSSGIVVLAISSSIAFQCSRKSNEDWLHLGHAYSLHKKKKVSIYLKKCTVSRKFYPASKKKLPNLLHHHRVPPPSPPSLPWIIIQKQRNYLPFIKHILKALSAK
jgi:hypothetical protein